MQIKTNKEKYLIVLISIVLFLVIWYFFSFIQAIFKTKNLPNFIEPFKYFFTFFSITSTILINGLIFSFSYFYFKKNKDKKSDLANAKFLKENEINKIFKKTLFLEPHLDYGFVIRIGQTNKILEANIINKTHALVVGKTGSGKTQNIIAPTIIYNAKSVKKPCMVFTDPKGELFKNHSKFLTEQGYQIKVLDLKNFKIGNYWNPLTVIFNYWVNKNYGEAQREIDVLVNAIAPIPSAKANFDSHWIVSAQNLIKGVIFALLEDYELGFNVNQNNFHFASITNIVLKDLESLKKYLIQRPLNSKARQYSSNLNISSTESKEIDSIISSVKTILNKFTNINLETILSKNTINIESFTKQATAIFLITADYSNEYHFLANIFIQQVYKTLALQADNNPNQTLARPILFLCDEFGNMPAIVNFNNIISASRSRNMWWMLICQDLEQLKHKYGTADNMLSNCDLQIYIHTNNFNSAKLLSQTYGTEKSKSTSSTVNNKNKSITTHDKEESLISANELLKLPENTQIIKYNRNDPAKVKTLPMFKIKEYKPGVYSEINKIADYKIEIYDINSMIKKSNIKSLKEKILWLVKQSEIKPASIKYLKTIKNEKEFEKYLIEIKGSLTTQFIEKMIKEKIIN